MLGKGDDEAIVKNIKEFNPIINGYTMKPAVIFINQERPETRPLVVLNYLSQGNPDPELRTVDSRFNTNNQRHEVDVLSITIIMKDIPPEQVPGEDGLKGDILGREYLILLRRYINYYWDRAKIPYIRLTEKAGRVQDISSVLAVEYQYAFTMDVKLRNLEDWNPQVIEEEAPTVRVIEHDVELVGD